MAGADVQMNVVVELDGLDQIVLNVYHILVAFMELVLNHGLVTVNLDGVELSVMKNLTPVKHYNHV